MVIGDYLAVQHARHFHVNLWRCQDITEVCLLAGQHVNAPSTNDYFGPCKIKIHISMLSEQDLP